jgi:hypothetical protein
LYIIPQILPNLLLRRPRNVDEITSNFDMGPVDDWKFWPDFLDQRDQTRHLRIICDADEVLIKETQRKKLPMKATSTPP